MYYKDRDISGHYMHKELVKTIQDCEATCEHMTHHLKKHEADEYRMRVNQATLLRDCADICTITAKYVARDSIFAENMAALCAEVCICCGNECVKFHDEMSQHCAMVCFHCGRECSDFARRGM
jgi:hypothetical protein